MSEQQPGRAGGYGDRCPSCGARVTVSQPWCTLCHARLDEPAPGGPRPGDLGPGDGDLGPGDGVRGPEEPSRPARRDGAAPTTPGPGPVPGAPGTSPPGAAEAMLAELAASTSAGRARGPVAGRSRAVRTALAVGAALVLTVLGVGLLTLVGLLL
ncbi:hypothetical protein [Aquipuribacter sp. MA13-6]|uniref:hypothetical protein n=1 Tax=unclassified Aquipuribacter TaxID=2635084 RepID=UPI003EEB27F3